MPDGAGVDKGGFDGVCRAEASSPFCPSGRSLWEMSTERRVADKLNRDYLKRTKDLKPGNPDAFVLVTPRIYNNKRNWVAERQKEGRWREVRVFDAADLAAWLEQCPAVGAWFAAEHLGRPVQGLISLSEFLVRWERATRPPLQRSLLLRERRSEVEKVSRWLTGAASALHVRAGSFEEARAFAAAAIEAEDPDGDRWAASAVVVETPDVWRALTRQSTEPLVLIPNFAADPPLDRGQHFAVVPTTTRPPADARTLTLDSIPWRAIQQVLRECLLDEARALELARDSQGNLHALRTLLGLRELPAWAADPRTHLELTALLFIGAWDPRSDGDRSALESLGADPDRLDGFSRHLCQVEGQPLLLDDGAYRWSSPRAAWLALLPLITEHRLRAFAVLAKDVLGEDDPRYDLPPDQRFAAPAYGKVPRHSELLRRAVAESLLWLAYFNDPLREQLGRSVARECVDDVVHTVLTPPWRRWASLDELLTLLAEAAPATFLRCLRASLADAAGVARFFAEEGHPGLARATPHVPLVWALEVLAWDAARIEDAADCLATLATHDPAESDPAGRVANRPSRSLDKIFHRLIPQTHASDEERDEILARLAQRHPDVAFALMNRLLRQSDRPSSSHHPRVLETFKEAQLPTAEQVAARTERLLKLLLQTAGTDPTRWSELVRDALDRVLEDGENDSPSARWFMESLVAQKDKIRDPDARIWNAAQDRLGTRAMLDPAASRERARARMRRVAAAFDPADPWAKFLRTFRAFNVPDDASPATVHYLIEWQEEQRVAALDALPSSDVEPHILKLFAHIEDLRELGRALSRSRHGATFAAKLLDQIPPEPWTKLVAPFAAGCYYTRGQDLAWLGDLTRRWSAQARRDDIVATLLKIWVTPTIWDLLDEMGEPVKSQYWAQIRLVGQHPEGQWERACSELLAANNLTTALQVVCSNAPQLSTESLLRTLEGLDRPTLEHTGHSPEWSIKLAFDELDRRVDAGQLDNARLERLTHMEIRFARILERHRALRYVRALLETSPDLFASVVRLLGSRADDPDPARSAYAVLQAWTTYPGEVAADPRVWEPRLLDWAGRALSLLAGDELGLIEVARVLARPSAAEDGHWPCEAARTLIESGQHPHLGDHLATAKYNLRGVVSYSPGEGGTKERALAETFRRSAAALRGRWPATALVLENLAERYRQEAEGWDNEARQERRAAGWPMNRPPATGLVDDEQPASSVTTGAPARTATETSHGLAAVLSRLTRIEIEGVGPAESMSLTYAERLTLIAGDNSLGKTFLLDLAWWTLTGTWPELDARDDRGAWITLRRVAQPSPSARARIRVYSGEGKLASVSSYQDQDETWSRPANWPHVRSPVVYARVDGGYSAWDPLLNDEALPAYHFSEPSLWHGLSGREGPLCEGLLADWHEWQLGAHPNFTALLQALQRLSPDGVPIEPGPDVRLRKHDPRKIPQIRFPYGDVPFEHLSAGWRRMLGIAYLLVWTWQRHRETAQREGVSPAGSLVLLLDEPENHLHPRWQRRLLPALLSAVEGFPETPAVQLIVTTHSPMIVASIEPHFDRDRDQVLHLELDDERRVVVRDFPWAKFGDASGWLTSPLFGLGRATSPEAERALAAARALMAGKHEELPPELGTPEKIDAALQRSVAETNPFWLRWSIFRDAGGAT